jgi:hypothetical protein
MNMGNIEFTSTKDKQEKFYKELKELLVRYRAELALEDFGKNYIGDFKIVVDFEYDESFFDSENTGVVPQLVLGNYGKR